MRKATTHERFWGKFTPEPTTGCWLWTGAHNKDGYGNIHNSYEGGKRIGYSSAHRVSWEIHNGKIPEGLCVLHSCDTPACVNPKHLHLGTNQENTAEKTMRGRAHSPKGEGHPSRKLSDEDINRIREIVPKGATFRYGRKWGVKGTTPITELAEKYGISVSHVRAIINRAAWNHI